MLNILQTWLNKKRRVVSADRYFSLVQAFDNLKKRGLIFIGVVKTLTIGLFVEQLSEVELACRGLWNGYFSLDN